MDVSTVADELYGLPPGEFTSQRAVRAAAARRAGDRELAAAIKKLRRPTTSAWLANLLVRRRPDQLLQLLELGAAMRLAQGQLAGSELRQLSQQRHQVIRALSGEARRLSRDLGRSVSEASGRELEVTLEAALADADAGDAVRSGRLTSALNYSGLGPVDVSGAGPPGVEATPSSQPPARDDRADAARKRHQDVEAAEKTLRHTQTAAGTAEQEADERERHLRAAREQLQLCRQQVAELEQQLQDVRIAGERAGRDLGDAEQARDEADRQVRAAHDRVDQARTVLEQLRG